MKIKTSWLAAFLLFGIQALAAPPNQTDWHTAFPAFKIAGNLYYVGTADLYLGAHGAYFGLKGKYRRMQAGESNPFIDPAGYRRFVASKKAEFQSEWERQKQHPGSPAP